MIPPDDLWADFSSAPPPPPEPEFPRRRQADGGGLLLMLALALIIGGCVAIVTTHGWARIPGAVLVAGGFVSAWRVQ